jgi:hypothetical protein
MFLSHIVIPIHVSQVIWLRSREIDKFAIWTFSCGHFILKVDRNKVMKVQMAIMKLSNRTSSELSDYPFLAHFTGP